MGKLSHFPSAAQPRMPKILNRERDINRQMEREKQIEREEINIELAIKI